MTYFYFIKTDISELIPLLGVFLIAGLRMMPSLNILMHSFNNLKFAQYPLNEIFDELGEDEINDIKQSFNPIKKKTLH